MNDQTTQLQTACRCAQFCMLCVSTCVASFTLSTMVSPLLKVCLSLYTLLRSHFRSHLFVNCCIRRYSIYMFGWFSNCGQIHLPHATFSHAQSLHSTDHLFSLAQVKDCLPKISDPSTRHVSSCASLHIEHQNKFSLTCLSCVTVVLYSYSRLVVPESIITL